MPNLQIHIHKVDGGTSTFIQNDAGEAGKILDGFAPENIFDRDRFVITDGNSITTLPASKITRIDLIYDRLPQPFFPVVVVGAVELTETEFQALIRNPVMREQWKQTTTRDDPLVIFLDLELADGQRLFLTNEMQAELQSEEPWRTNGYPWEGSSLCFRMLNGGMAVLNLSNLIRLTFFPKPVHVLPDAWQVRQSYPPFSAHVGASHTGPAALGNPTAESLVQEKRA